MRVSGIRLSLGLCFVLMSGVLATSSCSTAYKESIGAKTESAFTRIYMTDFNTAWQSVLDALKSSRLDVSNREGGFLQTKWTDNTSEKNFTDAFAGADSDLKAQFRFRVNVAKGFYNGKPSIKVAVQREQLVQRDVLEGWQPVESDSIEENTLLYRIGRIIQIRTKLAKLEEERMKKELKKAGM
jgi:hypothetical protein